MKLQCGYIPGTPLSMRYHPIQNIKFSGRLWTTCNIKLNDTTIHTIINSNENYNVELKVNNCYGIELMVNNQKIYESHNLYYVDLFFDYEPKYELIKSMIVDN